MRVKSVSVTVLILLMLALAVPVSAQDFYIPIRVGLSVDQISLSVASIQGCVVEDLLTGKAIAQAAAKQSYVLKPAKGTTGISIADFVCSTGGVRIRPIDSTDGSTNLLWFQNHCYRGFFDVLRFGDKLNIINELDLEQYLFGVVPAEVPSEWPIEAIKAQAVASRSYVITCRGSNQAKGFDVWPDTRNQVYKGFDGEEANTNKAVADTTGMVIAYQGKVVPGIFMASAGGMTEDNDKAWPGSDPLPYLRAVPSFDAEAPRGSWTVVWDADKLNADLKRRQINVGELLGIDVLERGTSGRAYKLQVRGSLKTITVVGTDKIRSFFGGDSAKVYAAPHDVICSNPQTGFTAAPAAEGLLLHVVGATGTTQTLTGAASVVGKDQVVLNLPIGPPMIISRQQAPAQITLRGGGWGHGVGMSQEGARTMAAAAPKGTVDYYQVILKHYYTGVDILKLVPPAAG